MFLKFYNFRFNFINGFNLGTRSSLGLGIGFRSYKPIDNPTWVLISDKMQIPVFIDFRTTFTKKRVSPYFAFDLGASAGLDSTKSKTKGLLVCPSAGIWIRLSGKKAIFGGVAYEVNKLEFNSNELMGFSQRNSSSVSLNIGIAF